MRQLKRLKETDVCGVGKVHQLQSPETKIQYSMETEKENGNRGSGLRTGHNSVKRA
jgi:hypothetical protein